MKKHNNWPVKVMKYKKDPNGPDVLVDKKAKLVTVYHDKYRGKYTKTDGGQASRSLSAA
jgi:hypothetical protein